MPVSPWNTMEDPTVRVVRRNWFTFIVSLKLSRSGHRSSASCPLLDEVTEIFGEVSGWNYHEIDGNSPRQTRIRANTGASGELWGCLAISRELVYVSMCVTCRNNTGSQDLLDFKATCSSRGRTKVEIRVVVVSER